MEQFDIYTLGAGYYLEKIFNGLRMILDGNFASIMKTASIGAVVVLAIRAGINNDFKAAVKWFLGVTILAGLFLNQKAIIHIHDKLPDAYGQSSVPRTVENVPWGLAFIGSITSQIGNSIAEKFDASLSGVFNNADYQKTGILFGTKLVEDISKLRVSDNQLKHFMLQFYKKCIVPDLNMGLKRANGYTVKDLVSAYNILEFLVEHSSKARLIHMPGNITKDSQIADGYISCKEGANQIYKSMQEEADRRIPILAKSFLSYFQPDRVSTDSSEIFKSVLAGSYGIFIKNSSKDAKDILLQTMAINAFGDVVDGKVYGRVVTEAVTKSAYYSVSQMAQKFVPILRAVLECLFYGVFPLVLILMVTPIGLEVLKNYSFGFIYLQLWQPMYAILFCIAASWGKLYASGINDITFASNSNIARINEEISSVAGYMLTLVPVLSLFITKGMVASMGNLASSITYIPQSAAVQNAESSVKGNYQIGNSSIDTYSSNTTNANKHDDNYAWMSGMKSFAMPSGSHERLFSDSSNTLDMSGAINNMAGLAKVDMNKAIGSRYDQSINDNMSSANRHASSVVESRSAAYSKLLGYDESFSKNSNAYASWSSNLSSDQRSSIDEARSFVSKVAKDHNMNEQDALRIAVAANTSKGFGTGLGFLPKITASLGLSGSATANKSERYSKAMQASQDKRFANSLSEVENFVHSSSHQEGNSINNNMIDSVRSDLNRAKSANMEMSKSVDRVHNLQSAKAAFEQNSSNISQDLTNQFVEENKEKFGTSGFEHMVRSDHQQIKQLLNEFVDKHIGTESANIPQEFNRNEQLFTNPENYIRNMHQQNAKTIQDAHQDHNLGVNQISPDSYRENIKNEVQSSEKQKSSVNQKLASNAKVMSSKSLNLDNKASDLEANVKDKTSQTATGTLLGHFNLFKKDE